MKAIIGAFRVVPGQRPTDSAVSAHHADEHCPTHWEVADLPLYRFMKDLYLARGGGDRNFSPPCNLTISDHDPNDVVLMQNAGVIAPAMAQQMFEAQEQDLTLVYFPLQ
jgi:hypothetical protein